MVIIVVVSYISINCYCYCIIWLLSVLLVEKDTSVPENDVNCSQDSAGSTVILKCRCSENIYEGYQVILLREGDRRYKLFANHANCSMSAHVTVDMNGKYYIIVFEIKKSIGITNSTIFFTGYIVIGGSNSSSTPIIGKKNKTK